MLRSFSAKACIRPNTAIRVRNRSGLFLLPLVVDSQSEDAPPASTPGNSIDPEGIHRERPRVQVEWGSGRHGGLRLPCAAEATKEKPLPGDRQNATRTLSAVFSSQGTVAECLPSPRWLATSSSPSPLPTIGPPVSLRCLTVVSCRACRKSYDGSIASVLLCSPQASFRCSDRDKKVPPFTGNCCWRTDGERRVLSSLRQMGFLNTLLGILGFGTGLFLGLLVGYFIFIYFEPTDLKEPVMKQFQDLDTKALRLLLPIIPVWMKCPDYDRVDWLNKFILEMWPYLDKAVCNMIRSTTMPIFDQYIGKFHIKSIKFDRLTLGSLPPVIQGVKVYEIQEKEIIIEPVLCWASNSNIIVAVIFLGLRVTLQLTDLQIFMSPRVTLKPLVPTFPCFANVTVSLLEKPHVDFGLRIVGADVMAIPGLYRFVQKTIKEQVANLYHWPQVLEVPLLDSSSGAMRKPVGILHVKVLRAINLPKMDLLGKSDPYVKLSLSGERLSFKKTKVKMSELNPEWNEEFKLIVKDPETQVLHLHVYDWEKIKAHDKIGMQVIPLRLLAPYEKKSFTLDLLKSMDPNQSGNKRHRGRIMVELTFAPFRRENSHSYREVLKGEEDASSTDKDSLLKPSNGGVLSVTIERAENVEGKRHNNPYALVVFRGDQKKTKVIKRSRDPRWVADFQFVSEKPPIDERLHIEVKSKRKGFNFYPQESLGYVAIDLTDVVNNESINEKYHLINSRHGIIHVETRWSTV